jgi:hypothetical protein
MWAQSESNEQTTFTQYWLDYNMKHAINDTKSISGFLAFRTKAPNVYDRYVINATYKIKNFKSPSFLKLKKPLINSYHLGGGLFMTDYEENDNNLELRLMQGLQIYTPQIKGLYLNNYLRLEERFQKAINDEPWTFGLRMRYRVSTVLEWKKKGEKFDRGLYVPLSIEFFFNFKPSDRNNDQIRVSPGLGYKFNKDWRCEFLVSYHNVVNDAEEDQKTNDFVFRIRVYKSNIKKGIFVRDKEGQLKELMED